MALSKSMINEPRFQVQCKYDHCDEHSNMLRHID